MSKFFNKLFSTVRRPFQDMKMPDLIVIAKLLVETNRKLSRTEKDQLHFKLDFIQSFWKMKGLR